MDAEHRLRSLYRSFNARDVEGVLAACSDDVDWPNAWEGGRLHGKDAVRDYWSRQWAAIDPRVDPVSITERADGTIAVDVHQVVRGLDGEQLAENRVVHAYTFVDGLVSRMDVEAHDRPNARSGSRASGPAHPGRAHSRSVVADAGRVGARRSSHARHFGERR